MLDSLYIKTQKFRQEKISAKMLAEILFADFCCFPIILGGILTFFVFLTNQ